jgi:hypothetical protein
MPSRPETKLPQNYSMYLSTLVKLEPGAGASYRDPLSAYACPVFGLYRSKPSERIQGISMEHRSPVLFT